MTPEVIAELERHLEPHACIGLMCARCGDAHKALMQHATELIAAAKHVQDCGHNKAWLHLRQHDQHIGAPTLIEVAERIVERAEKAEAEYKKLKDDYWDYYGRSQSELTDLRKDKARLELSYRKHLWLSHGHTGLYGDDGEMQCSACLTAGGPVDYKRAPLRDIESHIYEMRRREAIDAARKEPGR